MTIFLGCRDLYTMVLRSGTFLWPYGTRDWLKRYRVSSSILPSRVEDNKMSRNAVGHLSTRLAASIPKNKRQVATMAPETTAKMTWVLIPLCTRASLRAYLATVLT